MCIFAHAFPVTPMTEVENSEGRVYLIYVNACGNSFIYYALVFEDLFPFPLKVYFSAIHSFSIDKETLKRKT